jgi:hypothetical protein
MIEFPRIVVCCIASAVLIVTMHPMNALADFGAAEVRDGCSSINVVALQQARTMTAQLDLLRAAAFYRDAVYPYLWTWRIFTLEEVAALKEYKSVLSKLDRKADAAVVEQRVQAGRGLGGPFFTGHAER